MPLDVEEASRLPYSERAGLAARAGRSGTADLANILSLRIPPARRGEKRGGGDEKAEEAAGFKWFAGQAEVKVEAEEGQIEEDAADAEPQTVDQFVAVRAVAESEVPFRLTQHQLALFAAAGAAGIADEGIRHSVKDLFEMELGSPSLALKNLAAREYVRLQTDDSVLLAVLLAAVPHSRQKLIRCCSEQRRVRVLEMAFDALRHSDGLTFASGFLHACSTPFVRQKLLDDPEYQPNKQAGIGGALKQAGLRWSKLARFHGEVVLALFRRDLAAEQKSFSRSTVWLNWNKFLRRGRRTTPMKELLQYSTAVQLKGDAPDRAYSAELFNLALKYPSIRWIGDRLLKRDPSNTEMVAESLPELISDNLFFFGRYHRDELVQWLRRSVSVDHEGSLRHSIPSTILDGSVIQAISKRAQGSESVFSADDLVDLLTSAFSQGTFKSFWEKGGFDRTLVSWIIPSLMATLPLVACKRLFDTAFQYVDSLMRPVEKNCISIGRTVSGLWSTWQAILTELIWSCFSKVGMRMQSALTAVSTRHIKAELERGHVTSSNVTDLAHAASVKRVHVVLLQHITDLYCALVTDPSHFNDPSVDVIFDNNTRVTDATKIERKLRRDVANSFASARLATLVQFAPAELAVGVAWKTLLFGHWAVDQPGSWLAGKNSTTEDDLRTAAPHADRRAGMTENPSTLLDTFAQQLFQLLARQIVDLQSEVDLSAIAALRDAIFRQVLDILRKDPIGNRSRMIKLLKCSKLPQEHGALLVFETFSDVQLKHLVDHALSFLVSFVKDELLPTASARCRAAVQKVVDIAYGVKAETVPSGEPTKRKLGSLHRSASWSGVARATRKLSEADEDMLQPLRNYQDAGVRATLTKATNSSNVNERHAALNQVTRAAFLSHEPGNISKQNFVVEALEFVANRLRNESAENRARMIACLDEGTRTRTFESALGCMPAVERRRTTVLKRLFCSDALCFDSLIAGATFANQLMLPPSLKVIQGMLDDALQSPDLDEGFTFSGPLEFETSNHPILKVFWKISVAAIDAGLAVCAVGKWLDVPEHDLSIARAQFEIGIAMQWAIFRFRRGERVAAKEFTLGASVLIYQAENATMYSGYDVQVLYDMCKAAYMQCAPTVSSDGDAGFESEPRFLKQIFQLVHTRWAALPALIGSLVALIADLRSSSEIVCEIAGDEDSAKLFSFDEDHPAVFAFSKALALTRGFAKVSQTPRSVAALLRSNPEHIASADGAPCVPSFAAPAWWELAVLRKYVDFVLHSVYASSVLWRWLGPRIHIGNRTERKNLLREAVDLLLSISRSAIHIRLVARYVFNARSDLVSGLDLLPKEVSDSNTDAGRLNRPIGGVFYREALEDGWTSRSTAGKSRSERRLAHGRLQASGRRFATGGARQSLPSLHDPEALARSLDELALEEAADPAAKLCNRVAQHVRHRHASSFVVVPDHSSYFMPRLSPSTATRLLPEQVARLSAGLLAQVCNPDRPQPQRALAAQRWCLLPTVSFSDMLAALCASSGTGSEAKDSLQLPLAVTEALINGVTRTDEPPVAMAFLFDPVFLSSDRSRIAVYSIRRLVRFLPADGLTSRVSAVLTNDRTRSSLKVSAYKELIRLLASRPNEEHINMVLTEWNRKSLHRDVRLAILLQVLQLLHTDYGASAAWKILRECATKVRNVEVLVALLGAQPPTGVHTLLSSAAAELCHRKRYAESLTTLEHVTIPREHCDEYASSIILHLAQNAHDEDVRALATAQLGSWRQFGIAQAAVDMLFKHVADVDNDDAWYVERTDINAVLRARWNFYTKLMLEICGISAKVGKTSPYIAALRRENYGGRLLEALLSSIALRSAAIRKSCSSASENVDMSDEEHIQRLQNAVDSISLRHVRASMIISVERSILRSIPTHAVAQGFMSEEDEARLLAPLDRINVDEQLSILQDFFFTWKFQRRLARCRSTYSDRHGIVRDTPNFETRFFELLEDTFIFHFSSNCSSTQISSMLDNLANTKERPHKFQVLKAMLKRRLMPENQTAALSIGPGGPAQYWQLYDAVIDSLLLTVCADDNGLVRNSDRAKTLNCVRDYLFHRIDVFRAVFASSTGVGSMETAAWNIVRFHVSHASNGMNASTPAGLSCHVSVSRNAWTWFDAVWSKLWQDAIIDDQAGVRVSTVADSRFVRDVVCHLQTNAGLQADGTTTDGVEPDIVSKVLWARFFAEHCAKLYRHKYIEEPQSLLRFLHEYLLFSCHLQANRIINASTAVHTEVRYAVVMLDPIGSFTSVARTCATAVFEAEHEWHANRQSADASNDPTIKTLKRRVRATTGAFVSAIVSGSFELAGKARTKRVAAESTSVLHSLWKKVTGQGEDGVWAIFEPQPLENVSLAALRQSLLLGASVAILHSLGSSRLFALLIARPRGAALSDIPIGLGWPLLHESLLMKVADTSASTALCDPQPNHAQGPPGYYHVTGGHGEEMCPRIPGLDISQQVRSGFAAKEHRTDAARMRLLRTLLSFPSSLLPSATGDFDGSIFADRSDLCLLPLYAVAPWRAFAGELAVRARYLYEIASTALTLAEEFASIQIRVIIVTDSTGCERKQVVPPRPDTPAASAEDADGAEAVEDPGLTRKQRSIPRSALRPAFASIIEQIACDRLVDASIRKAAATYTPGGI